MKINFLHRKNKTKDQLIDEICSQLTKKGYQWEMREGELIVTKNDNKFRVCLWENQDHTIFRMYVIWNYTNDRLKSIEHWLLDVATCMTNREYPHTTSLMIAEDTYTCRFETAVWRAEDFIRELELSYVRITEAIQYFFNHIKEMEEKMKSAAAEANADEDYDDYDDDDDDFEIDPADRAADPTEEEDFYPWEYPIETIMAKAQEGDGESIYRIGVCFTFGLYGFEKDKSIAVGYYRAAVDEQNYQAMFNLAAMYSNADGVAYDHDQAIYLLSRIEKESDNNDLIQMARAARMQVNNLDHVTYLYY